MITFGITGSIACGKSTVTRFIRKAGVPIVDADIIAREVVAVETPGWGMIRAMFGHEYLNEDETINRTKLGALVFADESALHKLNGILGPLIEIESQRQVTAYHKAGHQLVGYDAALIIEKGNAEKYRPLLVVKAPFETQLSRLIARNDLTEAEARNRINKQLSSEEKAKYADFVIETTGTLEELEIETNNTLKQIKAYCKGFTKGLNVGFNIPVEG